MATAAQAVVLYCEKHPTEEVDMYCRRCKTPACTTCLRTFHNDHEFDTIATYSKRLASDRDGFLKDLTAKYERKRNPKRRKFHEVKCHNDHVLSRNVKSLEERRAKLHSIIDELIDKDMETCQTNNVKLTADLDKLKQKETETDDKIREMLTTFEKTIMTGLDIIEYYGKLSSLVERMQSDLDVAKYRDMLVYREGEVYRGQLQRMVGDVKEVKKESENDKPVTAKTELKKQAIATTEPKKQAIADSNLAKQKETRTFFSFLRSKRNVQEFKKVSEPKEKEKVTESDETKKISAFCYSESAVHDIRPVSHNEAWIKYDKIGQLTLLDKRGQVKDTVPYEAEYMTFFVMNDKDFISYDHEGQVVVSIEYSGKTSNIMVTSPLYPVHVGPALNGNILVTLVDKLEYTRTADSQRKVQMITPAGDLLHTYEFGEDGFTPIFTMPVKPTQNFNSNVCAINKYEMADGDVRGDVYVFYEDGGLKFLYSGHDGKFRPTDVCCDSLCNIICTNWCDSSVHVIDSDGAFLEYLLTSDTCVPEPVSVALYRDKLLIGSLYGEVRVYRYKY